MNDEVDAAFSTVQLNTAARVAVDLFGPLMEHKDYSQPSQCVFTCTGMSICSISVCLALPNQNMGTPTSAEGDIKSLHNYHPTFKELQEWSAAVGGGSLERGLSQTYIEDTERHFPPLTLFLFPPFQSATLTQSILKHWRAVSGVTML